MRQADFENSCKLMDEQRKLENILGYLSARQAKLKGILGIATNVLIISEWL